MKTTYAGHPCAVHKRFDLAGANSSGLRLNTRQATRAFIYTLIVLVSSSVTAAPDLGVVNYQLVSQKRLSLTVYDYTYRATVRNNGSEATGVNATLITYPAAVTPQDATLSFGDVAANTSQVSADTFVLRHNRTQGAFDTTKLFWTFDFQNPNLGLLDGPLGRPAVEATTDYSERTATYTPAQISETGFGPGVLFRRILRTRVLLKVKADATVAQVNAVLQTHGARITSMLQGHRGFSVAIPDPGSLPALSTVIQSMAAMPGVEIVLETELPEKLVLPPNDAYQGDPINGKDRLAHHLAVRVNAVWNARALFEKARLAGTLPEIVIIDWFGKGPPTDARGFDFLLDAGNYAIAPNDPNNVSLHGYGVASIIGASFGGNDADLTGNELLAGIAPVRLKLTAVDEESSPSIDAEMTAIAYIRSAVTANPNRRFILNTSYGSPFSSCKQPQLTLVGSTPILENICPDLETFETAASRYRHFKETQEWIDKARPLESFFLHFNSAGNNHRVPSVKSGPLKAAGQAFVQEVNPDGTLRVDNTGTPVGIVGLKNVVNVEGRYADNSAVRPTPTCNDTVSKQGEPNFRSFSLGGDLSAIGGVVDNYGSGLTETGVYNWGDPVVTADTGSSLAAPQAAGAAALVWAARPDLTVAQVKNILLRTTSAVPADCTIENGLNPGTYHEPLDAYAALLAADNPDFLATNDLGCSTPAATPVRTTLLDVAYAVSARVDQLVEMGDIEAAPDKTARFTQADLYLFLREFQKRRGATHDYSRYDLNGDGRTGEPLAARNYGQSPISVDSVAGFQRFDLNGDGQFTTARQTIEGVVVDFDERNTSDLSILVYYAYSPLYQGSPYERTLMLLPHLGFANAPNRTKPFLRRMQFNLQGLTATVSGKTALDEIYFQDFTNALINTFGTQFISPCGQERGAPLFTATVLSIAAGVSSADDVTAPTWWASLSPNRVPPSQFSNVRALCSDFIAAIPGTGRVFANITKFPSNQRTLEHQTRLDLGEPDLTAGAGAFTPGPRRLATQRGEYGFVDTTGSPAFVGNGVGNNFLLESVNFAGDTQYLVTERGAQPPIAPARFAALSNSSVPAPAARTGPTLVVKPIKGRFRFWR